MEAPREAAASSPLPRLVFTRPLCKSPAVQPSITHWFSLPIYQSYVWLHPGVSPVVGDLDRGLNQRSRETRTISSSYAWRNDGVCGGVSDVPGSHAHAMGELLASRKG